MDVRHLLRLDKLPLYSFSISDRATARSCSRLIYSRTVHHFFVSCFDSLCFFEAVLMDISVHNNLHSPLTDMPKGRVLLLDSRQCCNSKHMGGPDIPMPGPFQLIDNSRQAQIPGGKRIHVSAETVVLSRNICLRLHVRDS